MGLIVALRPKERVRQDSEPIALMYRNMGTSAAEQVVSRAFSELAITMAGLVAQVRAGDCTDLAKRMRRLQRMAEQLGLVSLGQVAVDMRLCLDGSDDTAFAAVWARLVRVAESSLASDKALLDRAT